MRRAAVALAVALACSAPAVAQDAESLGLDGHLTREAMEAAAAELRTALAERH